MSPAAPAVALLFVAAAVVAFDMLSPPHAARNAAAAAAPPPPASCRKRRRELASLVAGVVWTVSGTGRSFRSVAWKRCAPLNAGEDRLDVSCSRGGPLRPA